MAEKREEHQYDEEPAYHFSDEEIDYELAPETKEEGEAVAPKESLLKKMPSMKRMGLGLLVIFLLIWVIYKIITPPPPPTLTGFTQPTTSTNTVEKTIPAPAPSSVTSAETSVPIQPSAPPITPPPSAMMPPNASVPTSPNSSSEQPLPTTTRIANTSTCFYSIPRITKCGTKTK